MTGIDRHHHVTHLARDPVHVADFRFELFGCVNIHHQPIAILHDGLEHKGTGFHRFRQIEHNPHVIPVTGCRAHALDRRVLQVDIIEVGVQRRVVDVDHQAIRLGQGKYPVLYRLGDVEDNTSTFRRRPYPDPLDVGLPGQPVLGYEDEAEYQGEACSHPD